jgi:hypothetical protein
MAQHCSGVGTGTGESRCGNGGGPRFGWVLGGFRGGFGAVSGRLPCGSERALRPGDRVVVGYRDGPTGGNVYGSWTSASATPAHNPNERHALPRPSDGGGSVDLYGDAPDGVALTSVTATRPLPPGEIFNHHYYHHKPPHNTTSTQHNIHTTQHKARFVFVVYVVGVYGHPPCQPPSRPATHPRNEPGILCNLDRSPLSRLATYEPTQ